jgi:S-formylglutathione hydrolase
MEATPLMRLPVASQELVPRSQCLALLAICGLFFCAVQRGIAAPPVPHGLAQEITVHGQSLEGNLDSDSPNRKVSVYLPPSYSRDLKRRYPVVYMLHGFAENNEKWFGSEQKWINLPEMLDRSIANGTVHEFIVVVPDAYTKYQGSFYSNSIVTGNWEDFITTDLVRYIDAHYRTLATRESRGLAGQAMGGYGTIRIGMKHPDVFGSIYAMSPCCLMWGADFQPTGPIALKIGGIHTEGALDQADLAVHAHFAEAAAWSPNPANPPFYVDFPADAGETPHPDIIAKWSANLPLAIIDQYRKSLQRLNAIAFDVGNQDDFAHIPLGAQLLDKDLNDYNIPHTFEIYSGTHTSGIPERLETKVLPFFSKALVFGKPEKTPLPVSQTK